VVAKHQGSHSFLDFHETVCPMIYASNPIRQTGTKFQVQRSQQSWQLFGVGEPTDIALTLLHNLKIL
jgi:hypothetical protein